MAMIGSFYAPGEWVQPNQRNIGDSLLDLYKMKRQIEADRQAQEIAQMDLENKRLERATKLENAKMEREGQKKLADLLTPKPVVTGNLTDKYRKGMGTAADVANAAMKAAGAFTGTALPSVQASFPAQGLSQATVNRAQQDAEVDFENPELIGKLMQIAASTPSMRPVLDEIVKASITKKAQKNGRTFEEELALIEAKKGGQLAVQDAITARVTQIVERKAEIAQALQEGKFTQEGALMARKYLLDLDAELTTIRERARVTPPSPYETAKGTAYQAPIYDTGGRVVGWQMVPYAEGTQPQVPPQVQPPTGGGQTAPAPGNKVPTMAGPNAPSMPEIPMPTAGMQGAIDSGLMAAAPGTTPGATGTADLGTPPDTATGTPPVQYPVQPRVKPGTVGAYTPEQRAAININKVQNEFRSKKFVKGMDTALFNMNKLNQRYRQYMDRGGIKSIAELTTLFEFIKGLDDSVVRESEISLFKSGQDFINRWKNILSGYTGSTEDVRILGEKFMREIVNESRMGFQARLNTYETLRKQEIQDKAAFYSAFGRKAEDYYKPLPVAYAIAARGGIVPSSEMNKVTAATDAELSSKPVPPANEIPEGYSNPKWVMLNGKPTLTLQNDETGKRRPIEWEPE